MASTQSVGQMVLEAATAAEMMSSNPKSLNKDSLLSDAVAMMATKGFNAAPVIDETGRPVGVLSGADVLIHQGESANAATEKAPAKVGDLMTPAVFSVTTDMPAHKLVEEMVQLNVHQLYVVDANHTLVGVVTAHDVLRRLHAR
jgi:CBS domain-containing protein